MDFFDFAQLTKVLFGPLCRLLAGLAAGLLLASLLESLRWTEYLARITAPLARLGHFGPATSAAFALAFVSPAAANGLLSGSYASNAISQRELVLANLFNGLPAAMKHAPTIFFITWPAVGMAAVIYVGLSLVAAVGRTFVTILLGRMLLKGQSGNDVSGVAPQMENEMEGCSRLGRALGKAWKNFCKRLPKLVYFTIPFYLLMWLGQQCGLFQAAESWLAAHLEWLSIIRPQAIGIVILQIVAETGATLGAASAALQDGGLTVRDVALAMLAGNILSTPVRALRHQLPAYAGFYRPGIALRLILANQAFRAFSLVIVVLVYAVCTA